MAPIPTLSVTNKLLQQLETLSYEQFAQTITDAVRRQALQLRAAPWLHDIKPADFFLQGDITEYAVNDETQNSTHYVPFVERRIVAAGSRIISFGDLHGDLEALITMLQELVEQGILDQEYTIVDDRVHLVFIGDFVNRGLYSMEVVYLLIRLHEMNTGQVILVRGNHEYAASCKKLYIKYMEGEEVHPGNSTLLGQLSNSIDVCYYPDLLYWFDYLPLAVFIGEQDSATGVTHFVQLCHGAIEIGYNPANLLNSEDRFEYIKQLDRFAAVQQLAQLPSCQQLSAQLQEIATYTATLDASQALISYCEQGPLLLDAASNPFITKIGLQWHYCMSQAVDAAITVAFDDKNRTMHWSDAIIAWYMQRASCHELKLVGIVRGHQHINTVDTNTGFTNPMLDEIIAGNGCAWRMLKESVFICTLGDTGMRTGFNAFVIMQLQGDFKAELVYKAAGDEEGFIYKRL